MFPVFQNMDRIPSPKMLTMDLNDENIIMAMPDDKDPDELDDKPTTAKEKKVDHMPPLFP